MAGAACAPTSAAEDIPPEWVELCVLELEDVVEDDDDDDAGEEDAGDEDPDEESDDDDGEDVPGDEPSCDGMVCVDSPGEPGGDAGDVGDGGCTDSWRCAGSPWVSTGLPVSSAGSASTIDRCV